MSRGQYASSSICSRRHYTDVFHNDPFKVQSYNFRYADRPVYEVQHYQRLQLPQSKPPTFETYYQNPKFITKIEGCKTAPATSLLAEALQFCRRQIGDPVEVPNLPLLRTCCNRAEYKTMRRGQSISTLAKDISSSNVARKDSSSASVSTLKEPQRNHSTSTFKLSPQRSDCSCSCCAINININGLEPEPELNKSLRIKINTDSCLHNNTDNFKVNKSHTVQTGSSESFVIDKRLSKFSISEAQTSKWARKGSCERDLLIAKRERARSERERIEKVGQQELQKEQQRMRRREQAREHLRQLERQRDCERLQERELELESQRKREKEKEGVNQYQEQLRCDRQYRLPMRAMSMPTSVTAPVVTTSHLCKPTSTDRLPGMVPCYVHQSSANSSSQSSRAERLQIRTRKQKPQRGAEQEQTSCAPRPTITLERRSSGSSNCNASVLGSGSNSSLRQLSATRLNERKLLNLHVNGSPVSSNQPIHARLNNMPIRITTSQPADEDLQFSFNEVRVRNDSPAARPAHEPRPSCGRNSSRLDESVSMPYNVNINVYADNQRAMRL